MYMKKILPDEIDSIIERMPKFEKKEILDKAGRKINGFSGIYFKDQDEKPVTIVSNKYQLINHSEILQSIKSQIQNFREVKYTLINDTKFILDLFLNKFDEILPGDTIQYAIRIMNSVDTTICLSIFPMSFRLVCSNGLIHIERSIKIAYKHFQQIKEIDLNSTIESFYNIFSSLTDRYKKMTETKVIKISQLSAEKRQKLDIPQKYLEIIEDREYNSAWELLNDLTHLNTFDNKRNEYTKTFFNQKILKLVEAVSA